eukprot:jgi/Botrbrau1/22221/Bobra.168_1s0052.1
MSGHVHVHACTYTCVLEESFPLEISHCSCARYILRTYIFALRAPEQALNEGGHSMANAEIGTDRLETVQQSRVRRRRETEEPSYVPRKMHRDLSQAKLLGSELCRGAHACMLRCHVARTGCRDNGAVTCPAQASSIDGLRTSKLQAPLLLKRILIKCWAALGERKSSKTV